MILKVQVAILNFQKQASNPHTLPLSKAHRGSPTGLGRADVPSLRPQSRPLDYHSCGPPAMYFQYFLVYDFQWERTRNKCYLLTSLYRSM